jgi:hypothetical protein
MWKRSISNRTWTGIGTDREVNWDVVQSIKLKGGRCARCPKSSKFYYDFISRRWGAIKTEIRLVSCSLSKSLIVKRIFKYFSSMKCGKQDIVWIQRVSAQIRSIIRHGQLHDRRPARHHTRRLLHNTTTFGTVDSSGVPLSLLLLLPYRVGIDTISDWYTNLVVPAWCIVQLLLQTRGE